MKLKGLKRSFDLRQCFQQFEYLCFVFCLQDEVSLVLLNNNSLTVSQTRNVVYKYFIKKLCLDIVEEQSKNRGLHVKYVSSFHYRTI